MLSRFNTIPERDGRTDGRKDREKCYIIAISVSRVSIAVLTSDTLLKKPK